jgi:hypothetical protein
VPGNAAKSRVLARVTHASRSTRTIGRTRSRSGRRFRRRPMPLISLCRRS